MDLPYAEGLDLVRGHACNQSNHFGAMSALHAAAERGDVGMVQMLLDRGADANIRSHDSYTPLHRAVLQNHGAVVKLLLDRGASAECRGNDGDSPLYDAALLGRGAIVRMLLETGTVPTTEFRQAISKGHVAILQTLLDNGADLNLHEKGLDELLLCAAERGCGAMVCILLDAGADFNLEKNWRLLHRAVSSGHAAIVEILLAKGADVNRVQGSGYQSRPTYTFETPLHYAAELGAGLVYVRGTIMQMLLDKGADVHARNAFGETPEQVASARGHPNVAAVLRAARLAQCEAFAMGQHERLGATSLVLGLEPGVVRMILDALEGIRPL